MPFTFKEFSINDSHCAMKVGTDSVLLGAWANFSNATTILDIGTGCGILALMAAQQSDALITAIDIEEQACIQAKENFKLSRWFNRLTCIHQSIQTFAKSNNLFDYIITNPPYFTNSLKSDNISRNTARHNDDLPLSILINSVHSLLQPGGRFSLVIPTVQKTHLDFEILKKGFYLSRQMVIYPKSGKAANRLLIEYIKETPCKIVEEEEMIIRNEEGFYTSEYIELTKRFYLHLNHL